MVNNSININKTKERLNSDGKVNSDGHNYININKTKESLNSDGQQIHQNQQNKRKFKQSWSTITSISTKQKKG